MFPAQYPGGYFMARLILLLFIPITLCLVGSVSLATATIISQNNTKDYTNPDFGYRIHYPSDWQLNSDRNDQVWLIYANQSWLESEYSGNEDRRPILNINVTREDISPQLKYIVEETEDQLEDELEASGNEDVNIISRSPVSNIPGEFTGTRIIFSYDDPNFGTTIEEKTLLARDDLLYDIVFRAEDQDYDSEIHDGARRIVDSIEIPAAPLLLTEETAQSLLSTIEKTLGSLNNNSIALNSIAGSLSTEETGRSSLAVLLNKTLLSEKTGLEILAAVKGQSGVVQDTAAQSETAWCGVSLQIIGGVVGSADSKSVEKGSAEICNRFGLV